MTLDAISCAPTLKRSFVAKAFKLAFAQANSASLFSSIRLATSSLFLLGTLYRAIYNAECIQSKGKKISTRRTTRRSPLSTTCFELKFNQKFSLCQEIRILSALVVGAKTSGMKRQNGWRRRKNRIILKLTSHTTPRLDRKNEPRGDPEESKEEEHTNLLVRIKE